MVLSVVPVLVMFQVLELVLELAALNRLMLIPCVAVVQDVMGGDSSFVRSSNLFYPIHPMLIEVEIVETLEIEALADIADDFDSGSVKSGVAYNNWKSSTFDVDRVAPGIVAADRDNDCTTADARRMHPADRHIDDDIYAVSAAVARNDDDTSNFGDEVVDDVGAADAADFVDAVDVVGRIHIGVGILVADGEISRVAESLFVAVDANYGHDFPVVDSVGSGCEILDVVGWTGIDRDCSVHSSTREMGSFLENCPHFDVVDPVALFAFRCSDHIPPARRDDDESSLDLLDDHLKHASSSLVDCSDYFHPPHRVAQFVPRCSCFRGRDLIRNI
mmetsp:Transcript_26056/g.54644  ORF Transcript_26056/g.54644 Transcript_26056/m.54644 type:complete len:332 (-) Transcript_26056:218-1213(-)